jgi:heptosyltransferase-2
MSAIPASKILVVGPSWVGDMVMAQSLFITLKQQQPDCVIDVLAPGWSRPLLERMPEVNAAIDMPLGHGEFGLGKRRQLGKKLRAKHYSQVIVLPNSWKSALVPFFTGAPKRTGYVGELRYGLLNDARKLDKSVLSMTVQRFCALAFAPDAPQPPPIPTPMLSISESGVESALNKHGLDKVQPIMVLCPGAEYGPAKRWPEEYYAEVARYWLEKGGQVWLFGSNKDEPVTAAINTQTGNRCVDLAGRTSLGEAIDLMSLATHVVSNDSGLMHVAASLGRSLVAIYGSSDPGFTPPLNEEAKVLRLGLDCSPCFKRECPLGHLKCLKDLLPAQVIATLESDQ